MGITKHKQILGLHIWKIAGIDLLAASSEQWENLSEWVMDSKGHIVDPSEWKEEILPDIEYMTIDIAYSDPVLGEEISNAGLDATMENISLLPIIHKLPVHTTGSRAMRPVARLVVELVYRCGSGWEQTDYDCDLDINLLGHLDDDLLLIPV